MWSHDGWPRGQVPVSGVGYGEGQSAPGYVLMDSVVFPYAHVTELLLSPAAKPALVEASPAGCHGQVCASMSLRLGRAHIHTFQVSQQGPGSRDSH